MSSMKTGSCVLHSLLKLVSYLAYTKCSRNTCWVEMKWLLCQIWANAWIIVVGLRTEELTEAESGILCRCWSFLVESVTLFITITFDSTPTYFHFKTLKFLLQSMAFWSPARARKQRQMQALLPSSSSLAGFLLPSESAWLQGSGLARPPMFTANLYTFLGDIEKKDLRTGDWPAGISPGHLESVESVSWPAEADQFGDSNAAIPQIPAGPLKSSTSFLELPDLIPSAAWRRLSSVRARDRWSWVWVCMHTYTHVHVCTWVAVGGLKKRGEQGLFFQMALGKLHDSPMPVSERFIVPSTLCLSLSSLLFP